MAPHRYPIPAETFRQELEVQRSRFIATVAPVATADEARAVVERLRHEFPDARHTCWAFLIGPPGSSDTVGCSDDGEPSGTAGKPILNACLHSDMGDLAVVVTRYFGGTKLGTGGLVRAYGQAAQQAIDGVRQAERIAWQQIDLTFDYAHMEALKRDLSHYEAELLEQTFADVVQWRLRVPVEQVAAFRSGVNDRCCGQVTLTETAPTTPRRNDAP